MVDDGSVSMEPCIVGNAVDTSNNIDSCDAMFYRVGWCPFALRCLKSPKLPLGSLVFYARVAMLLVEML